MRRLIGILIAVGIVAAGASAASAQVLRVGTWHRIPGQFSSIQNAVNAARPGDSILVAPGDYKTTTVHFPKGVSNFPAAVLITTGGVTLRGMNRVGVMVDGTVPGTPLCSSAAAAQSYGPSSSASGSSSSSGGYSRHAARAASEGTGLNGVEIYKAPNVTVQNLSTCNFLGGSDDAGNGIWWNGGADSGLVGGYGYTGSYLTATSTFYNNETTAAQYGIFSSNWNGGTWDQIYASNFNDSGFYIGACQQQCNQTLDHGWSEDNALGYSGTNSGGPLVIENSQFDHNEDGFDTNSQDADFPPPQNGACPNNGVSPITHTPLVLGVHAQQRARQQQSERPRGGISGGGSGGHRDVGFRRPQRHDHGQHIRQQRRLGLHPGALPRQHYAALHRGDPNRRPVRLRRIRRRGAQQHLRP
jgi:hypothetical protein